MGEYTLAVRRCFREAGVQPVGELADHLSNELLLMAHLWRSQAQEFCGADGSRETQRSRLRNDHLLKWVSELRSKVSEHERLGFYSTALRVVELVLENDSD